MTENATTRRAICPACEYPMEDGRGCTIRTFTIGGRVYARIPYGSPQDLMLRPVEDYPCHDCAVAIGQLHHFRCDAEACPRCGGQSLSCECA